MALLPRLAETAEVRVLAGGEAFQILSGHFPVERIPYLAFDYRGARVSGPATVASNAALVWDLLTRGAECRRVEGLLARFRPDVVVSDSEPLTLRAAARIGVPSIGFDHVGVIAHCRPRVPLRDRLPLALDGALYRLLVGKVDRAAVSSFYEAPPRRPGTRTVPPVLRDRVLRARPSESGHLLVYLNNGVHLYTRRVDEALRSAGRPVLVYGAGREGADGTVTHKPIDEAGFVEDLASCFAVVATGGHQLISEALFLGKPILVVPEACAEQRLNALQVQALGVGETLRHSALSGRTILRFLDRREGYRRALERLERPRDSSAFEALQSLVRELATGTRDAEDRPAEFANSSPARDPLSTRPR